MQTTSIAQRMEGPACQPLALGHPVAGGKASPSRLGRESTGIGKSLIPRLHELILNPQAGSRNLAIELSPNTVVRSLNKRGSPRNSLMEWVRCDAFRPRLGLAPGMINLRHFCLSRKEGQKESILGSPHNAARAGRQISSSLEATAEKRKKESRNGGETRKKRGG